MNVQIPNEFPRSFRRYVDARLRQFWFENQDRALYERVRAEVEAALAKTLHSRKYEVIVDASQEDIDQNRLNVIVRERSAVDQLGEIADE